MPTLAIRADAGPRVGWGHLMRCRSLALALRERGQDVGFITGGDGPEAGLLLARDGFSVHELGRLSDDQLEDLAPADAEIACAAARGWQASAILVDHYGATDSYLTRLASEGAVAVIDDCADRDLSSVSWILNQNLGAEARPYRIAPGAILLRGPAYALLRPEFARARNQVARSFSPKQRRVLVTLGGGDYAALTLAVLRALAAVPGRLHVRALCGAAAESVRGRLPPEFALHHEVEVLGPVEDMTDAMQWADVAINAGGSTCWELCCLGVPMLVLTTADNQRGNAEGLAGHGCAVNLGDAPSGLPALLPALLQDADRRRAMSAQGMTLVDGCGALRAADSLRQLVGKGVLR